MVCVFLFFFVMWLFVLSGEILREGVVFLFVGFILYFVFKFRIGVIVFVYFRCRVLG